MDGRFCSQVIRDYSWDVSYVEVSTYGPPAGCRPTTESPPFQRVTIIQPIPGEVHHGQYQRLWALDLLGGAVRPKVGEPPADTWIERGTPDGFDVGAFVDEELKKGATNVNVLVDEKPPADPHQRVAYVH